MTEVVGSSSISKKTSDLDSAIWHLSSGNRLSSFVTYDGHSKLHTPETKILWNFKFGSKILRHKDKRQVQ